MKRLTFAIALAFLAACGTTKTGTSGGTSSSTSSGNGAGNGAGTTGVASSGATSTGASSSTGGTSTATTSASTTASTGATSTTGGSSGSTGNCVPDGSFSSDPSLCCSGAVDSGGFCTSQSSTSTTSGTTGSTSTTGTGSTGGTTNGSSGTVSGTTTGGTCPSNMPDLVTGQGGYNAGTCNSNPQSAACPKGYHCDLNSNECVLNNSSTLQVTLSFDNIEDFDLHLLEPLGDGGYCEIFYGNPGTDPDAGPLPIPPGFGDAGFGGSCTCFGGYCFGDCDGGSTFPTTSTPCPVGWLDLDTNAACGANNNNTPDAVNTENILFPNWATAPSGTYYVRVDYWQNCDSTTCSDGQDSTACNSGHPSSNLAVQVRLPNSAIYQYCPAISEQGQGPNDQGANGAGFPDNGNDGSGFLVTSFTIP